MIRTLGKNGSISPANRQILEDNAYKLGISDDDLQKLIDEELSGIRSSSIDSSYKTNPSLGLKVSLGKKFPNSNSSNKPSDSLGRSSNDSTTQNSTTHNSATTDANPNSSVLIAAEPSISTPEPPQSSPSSSKPSSNKWFLIVAAVLFVGAVCFFFLGNNVNCNGTSVSTDSTATQNPVNQPSDSDTSQRTGDNIADTSATVIADTTSQQPRSDTTIAPPQRVVTDLDRLASKILEEQGDKQKQDNNIEKARQLYDSAARKDPNNAEVKQKLDELNGHRP